MLDFEKLVVNFEKTESCIPEIKIFEIVLLSDEISTKSLVEQGITAEMLIDIINSDDNELFSLFEKEKNFFGDMSLITEQYNNPLPKKRRLF